MILIFHFSPDIKSDKTFVKIRGRKRDRQTDRQRERERVGEREIHESSSRFKNFERERERQPEREGARERPKPGGKVNCVEENKVRITPGCNLESGTIGL